MHKSDSTSKITRTITDDARAQLECWAQENLTSLSAEMTRSVRFRAQAEHKAKAAVTVGAGVAD
jgi:hypothetical protein